MVHPPAEAIEARKNGRDNLSLTFAHQEEFALNRQLTLHHTGRVVPGRIIRERLLPQRYDLRFVRFAEGSDHEIGTVQRRSLFVLPNDRPSAARARTRRWAGDETWTARATGPCGEPVRPGP